MFLNDDVVDIQNPDGMHSLTFVLYNFSGLFVHSPIFPVKYSRYA